LRTGAFNLTWILTGHFIVHDYDENYPPVYTDGNANFGFYIAADLGWAVLLLPYAKSTQILQCPSKAVRPIL
jgi:hypothetical protein